MDSVDHMNFRMVGYLDDIKPKDTMHIEYPVLGDSIDCLDSPQDYVYFIAIGNNRKRKNWFAKVKAHNLSLINVIDKSDLVSRASELGEGCFIGKLGNPHLSNTCRLVPGSSVAVSERANRYVLSLNL